MPWYSYLCQHCGTLTELQQSIKERHDHALCRECGLPAARDWTTDLRSVSLQGDTVAGGVNYEGYDQALGQHIRGRSHLREVMKSRGLEYYDPPSEEAEISRDINYLVDRGGSKDPQGREELKQLAKKSGELQTKRAFEKTEKSDKFKKILERKIGEADL